LVTFIFYSFLHSSPYQVKAMLEFNKLDAKAATQAKTQRVAAAAAATAVAAVGGDKTDAATAAAAAGPSINSVITGSLAPDAAYEAVMHLNTHLREKFPNTMPSFVARSELDECMETQLQTQVAAGGGYSAGFAAYGGGGGGGEEKKDGGGGGGGGARVDRRAFTGVAVALFGRLAAQLGTD
jgi:hypothetical protein